MRAVELDPNNSDLHTRFGLTLSMAQDHRRAMIEFGKAVNFDPQNPMPPYISGCQ